MPKARGVGVDGVNGPRAEERFEIPRVSARLLGGDEPSAHPHPIRAGRQSCGAIDRPVPISSAASTGTRTASSTSPRSRSNPIMPRTWPPAPMPWAMMKSQPASTANNASSREPIARAARAPPVWTIWTNSGSGSA